MWAAREDPFEESSNRGPDPLSVVEYEQERPFAQVLDERGCRVRPSALGEPDRARDLDRDGLLGLEGGEVDPASAALDHLLELSRNLQGEAGLPASADAYQGDERVAQNEPADLDEGVLATDESPDLARQMGRMRSGLGFARRQGARLQGRPQLRRSGESPRRNQRHGAFDHVSQRPG